MSKDYKRANKAGKIKKHVQRANKTRHARYVSNKLPDRLITPLTPPISQEIPANVVWDEDNLEYRPVRNMVTGETTNDELREWLSKESINW